MSDEGATRIKATMGRGVEKRSQPSLAYILVERRAARPSNGSNANPLVSCYPGSSP